MKTLAFASRNTREILRDPLNLAFGLGFPLALLLLLSLIQSNIPVSLFEITNLIPGIVVFGFSFISLSSGMLIAKDRGESFLMRLFASPLTGVNFVLGYTLPLVPLAVLQSAICFITAFFLGLRVSIHVLAVFAVLLPVALFFIAIGLLAGSLLTDKQVGGICGALLSNLAGWLSGTWFDLDLVGPGFRKVAFALPFVHAVEAGKAALAGRYKVIMPHLWWVVGYAAVTIILATLAFSKRMKGD